MSRRKWLTGLVGAALLLTGAVNALAGFVVAPSGYGPGTVYNGGQPALIFNVSRTYQQIVAPSALVGLTVGDQITGISWRLAKDSGYDFPTVLTTWSDYRIWMGVGVAPGSWSYTFANNVVGSLTQVRSGPLTVPPNAWTSSVDPTGAGWPYWGYEVVFDTPYSYTGGNLLLEIRHSTSDNTSLYPYAYLDSTHTQNPDWGTKFTGGEAYGDSAIVANWNDTLTVSRLTVTPVPEPSTIAALLGGAVGLGAIGLAAWRRRRKTRPQAEEDEAEPFFEE